MGKNSKAQQDAERRRYMEEQRRKEEEKLKQQNRLMWQIVIAVVAVVLVITAVALAISFGGKNDTEDSTDDATVETTDNASTAVKMEDLDLSEKDISLFTASEEVTDYVKMNVTYTDKNGVEQTGDIVIRLFAEVAPETVANFQKLVKEDFYNGLTFHRVVEGFMIQGGDPEGDGSGNAATTIKGEFSANGFTNNLLHNRGVISMARRSDSYNSASCQFFIVHEESQSNHYSLDGSYASFGFVVYGMDTVDGIAETDVKANAKGEKSVPVNPITINDVSFVKLAE